jgi:hypothetical protein
VTNENTLAALGRPNGFRKEEQIFTMAQNTSHAVMAQRYENSSSLDDFPTPPWATRTFLENVLGGRAHTAEKTCLEPACNRGFMARPLKEYFAEVEASDIFDYGFGGISDFLSSSHKANSFDWVITNPPFKAAEQFAIEGLRVARVGVALLVRTTFIESKGRYERLFTQHPPTMFAQYVERVPMVKGRLDRKASTATGYGWLVWLKDPTPRGSQLVWIPPSRKKFEFSTDYEDNPEQLELLSFSSPTHLSKKETWL